MSERTQVAAQEPLALVGIGCRLPGNVRDAESYWRLLVDGKSAISEVPDERWHADRFHHKDPNATGRMLTRRGGFIDQLKEFDASFWGISPREAMRLDPQQRWLLEIAWEACEDAGIPPSKLRGANVGVFVGASSHDYGSLQLNDIANLDVHTNTGGTLSIAANRISYLFDLQGPSLAVDTACSSALVAVSLACSSIWSGECDAVLAGGVNALITPNTSIGFSKASMLSPSGECFAFDARADGYVRGEGAGLVLLKPLSQAIKDRDHIYSVIHAAAVSQDGHTSSMTVPSAKRQSDLLRQTLADANILPKHVSYVEAHGTGTPVGDPIEAKALGDVLSVGRPAADTCLLGSVKTNIGHLESASGIAGLIKAALVLQRETVPPNRNFKSPNSSIPFEQLQLKVADKLQPLPKRRGATAVAAVNSFGFGGTNANVVLVSPPSQPILEPSGVLADRPYLLPISARDDVALRTYVEDYRRCLKSFQGNVADFCYSAGARKEHHDRRLVAIGADAQELGLQLDRWLQDEHVEQCVITGRANERTNAPVFVFTGQGSQWPGMGRQLIAREPIVRRTIEEIDRMLRPMSGWSLIEEMCRPVNESNIHQTQIAQPAIFAIQVALVKLWESWGVKPSRVIGHSVGEVAAAWCAGIYLIEDAVSLVYHRSRLQATTGGAGKMIAAGITALDAQQLIGPLSDRVQITAINSPSLVTIGGDTKPIELLVNRLQEDGKFVRCLGLDYAFHTQQMDSIKDELLDVLSDLKPRNETLPLVSAVTGRRQRGETMDAQYWWRNVRQPVLFEAGLASLLADGHRDYLEIGPHPSLRSSIDECMASGEVTGNVFHSIARHTDESKQLAGNVASLHCAGVEIDWCAVDQSAGNFLRQPQYPWSYQEYWLDKGDTASRIDPPLHPLLAHRVKAAKPTWQFRLDPHVFAYLSDHRIWDGIVFPAAGFCEIGLAIAEELYPDERYVVEDVECLSALFVPDNTAPTIEVAFDASSHAYSVHSSMDGETWECNSRGRLVALPSLPCEAPTNLESLQTRLPNQVTHSSLYDELRELGYGFGERFSLLQQVFHGESEVGDKATLRGEALAKISIPESLGSDVASYSFHPAVLDACFQATHGTRYALEDTRETDVLYLPESVGRVQLFVDRLPSELWAHAIQTKFDREAIEYDVHILDNAGQTIASIQAFRVVGTKQSRSRAAGDDCLYQFKWEARRLKGTNVSGSCEFPRSRDLIAAADEATNTLYDERGLHEYYEDFAPRIQYIVLRYIERALLGLGWAYGVGDQFTVAELIDHLGIAAEHHQLLLAELGWLASEGSLRELDSGWQVVREFEETDVHESLQNLATEYPRYASETTLVQATGPHLADVLSGETDPLTLLFPANSSQLLEAFYTSAGDFPVFNRLMQTVIAKSTQSLPSRRAVRVLEIGAGTGSLTRQIIDALPRDRMEYLFTDIGGAFVAEARNRFADCPSMNYQTFDIQRPASEQGIEEHSFDLIIATNVLHATTDLRSALANVQSCLAPGGMFVFLEVVKRRPVWDNVFGLLKGWWKFTDSQERVGSPLLARDQWESLLSRTGFQDVSSFTCSPDPEQAVFVSFAENVLAENTIPTPSQALADAQTNELVDDENRPVTLMFVDEGNVSAQIAARFEQRGDDVIQLHLGDDFSQASERKFTLAGGSVEQIQRVFAAADLRQRGVERIIHCWSLDSGRPVSEATLLNAQRAGVLSGLGLAGALTEIELTHTTRVYFVTRSAQCTGESDRTSGFASSPLVGFSRVANCEASQFDWTVIDLDSETGSHEVDDLFDELTRVNSEHEVAFRGEQRLVNRLHRVQIDAIPQRRQAAMRANGSSIPFRLQMRKAGVLDDLSWNETVRREPAAGEIEIRVIAGGINFRDVMKALGMHPGNSIDLMWFGDDFSGLVERVGSDVHDLMPGDKVSGIAPYSFRTHVTVDRRMVFKHPAKLSWEQAATLPTVFMTAHLAICQIARMQAGEKILIHAAAGGVGQAAFQVAQHLGLEIFATAGTQEKRALLRAMGAKHVMNSRDVQFADQVLQHTGGVGVDAVLNSLAGEFIPKSLSVLAPFGRFLEIGKIDVYQNSKVGLAAFKNNISYHMIDLAQMIALYPERIVSLLQQLTDRFDAGDYRPLPHHVFPIADVSAAFRFMAQGQHIGKNVLSFELCESSQGEPAPMQIGPCTEDGSLLRRDASYLITGGAGGFGFEVAKWMASQGARKIALMSRSGPQQDVNDEIQSLRSDGVEVIDVRGDVTNQNDVRRVIDDLQQSGQPLKGVVHAAMVLDDDFITELDERRFNHVLHPKMLGAWNLHESTKDLSLDHFICFSSFSAIVGAPKQSNYNAGNCFLDALAGHRRSCGLPALTLNWGAVLGAGFVDRNQKTAEYLDSIGLQAFPVSDALDVLHEAILRDTASLGAGRVDWQKLAKLSPSISQLPMYAKVARDHSAKRSDSTLQMQLHAVASEHRLSILEDFVALQVAGVFGIEVNSVDRDTSLTSFGIDSLMAVELMNRVESATGTQLPMSAVLTGPSVRELSRRVLELMGEQDLPAGEIKLDSEQACEKTTSQIVDFELDAQLDASIMPTAPPAKHTDTSKLLLTGATGFIGAHLLNELLETTASEIICLVRAEDSAEGMQRIVDNLDNYGLQPWGLESRVTILAGDFSKRRLGLSQDAFDRLGAEVDVIYHNGANPNLLLPYESLHSANVAGTQEMLRLACHRKTKPVHFVSTFTVHATDANRGRVVTESDPLPCCEELIYGYAQTKWVSEKMIEEAKRRGMSVTIYRPGHVTGHSKTGAANMNDLLHTIVRACLLAGAAPLRKLRLDVTPVDFVSKAIIHLSRQESSLGKTFHLTNPHPLGAEALADWSRNSGTKIDLIPYGQWRDRLHEFARHTIDSMDSLQVLTKMFMPRLSGFSDRGIHPHYDCQQTLKALSGTSLKCPPADERLLATCYKYLQQSGNISIADPDVHLAATVSQPHNEHLQ